jgi:tetratricopeptide (TPR) repeat protein
VDPQKISFEVSREMLLYAGAPEMPLFVHSYHASPLLVGQWPGRSVYYGALLPWKSPLNADKLSYYGPTVSNSSVSLAMHMGCATIVLAGVDLCFSAEGQTHAAGSNENKAGPDLSQLTPQVETYGGRRADTNQGYAESLQVLGKQVHLAAEKGCRVYNCSLDAAKVPLVEYQLLDDLALTAGHDSTTKVIDRLVPESTAAARLTHYRKVRKEIVRARAKLQEILNLSRQALQCTDGLFGRNGMQRDFRHKLRMDKIERRLDRGFQDLSIQVKQFGLKQFLTILKTPKKAEEWTDEQIETVTREYYEAYLAGTEQLIGIIDGTLERIAARMEEEKETPDLRLLFSQWRKDEQFGRLSAWQKRNPQLAKRMTPSERDAAERIEFEFSRVMTEEATSQTDLIQRLHDVKHTRSKALILFRQKSIPDLEAMSHGLSGHPDQEKALPYLHFVEGLLAQLRDEPDKAAAHYEQLLTNPPHPLTEDALLQIAAISIAAKNVDSAILAVECLTSISVTYLPPYGELLKVAGRFEDAFNAYNRYVGLVPDDVGAMVRLGIFCREAGLTDAACELFNRALTKDPLNGAARMMLDAAKCQYPS